MKYFAVTMNIRIHICLMDYMECHTDVTVVDKTGIRTSP